MTKGSAQGAIWFGACVALGCLAVQPGAISLARSAAAAGASTSCPSGATAETPTSSLALPDGGSTEQYAVEGNVETHFLPPTDFKPLAGSSALLAEYGFPPRPQSTDPSYAGWYAAMNAYKGTSTDGLCLDDHPIGSPLDEAPTSGHSSGLAWSGYLDEHEGSQEIWEANGTWNQSATADCGCAEPTDESTWVGVGGVVGSNPGLIQDGTDMEANKEANSWYEYLSKSSQVTEQPGGVVAPNHTVYARVFWTGSAANFFVEDETTGAALVNVQVPLNSTYYNDASAEWINERPTQAGNVYYPLTNYTDTYWSGATYDIRNDNTALPLGKSDTIGDEMSSTAVFYPATCSSPLLMAYPWDLNVNGGTTFINTWCWAGSEQNA